MARLVKLFLLLLCLSLFDYEQATCSSLSPSPPSNLSTSDDANQLLCSHSEKMALLQFKNLFGENPPALITWKDEGSSDCCLWYGVFCDDLIGHVTGLKLSDSNLHGAIPSNSTLFHLSYLQQLDLSLNDLNGSTISPAFGLSFPHLTSLDLSFSNFAGSVSWLTNLTELELLDLSSNKLTGFIPTNISGLRKLIFLDLANNSLSGTLPPNLFDSPMLESVILRDNKLEGSIPGSTARLPGLFKLIFSNNNLSGTLGPQLFLNFQQLRWLDLSHNSFQGPLPQPRNSTMTDFLVSHNKLEGEIPLSYCESSDFLYLVLSHNNLSGVIPECIINSNPQLQILDLGMNWFHGTIPDNFSEGNQMLSINVKGNLLQGKLPHSLANCRHLRVLHVGNNIIKDTFPYWLQILPKLQVLVLRHNKFHGPLGLNARTKRTVNPFPKLRIFDLSHNEFVGPLPSNYFHTLSAMRNMSKPPMGSWLYMGLGQYDDTIEITLKGVDYELPRILNIFSAIDLSDNYFEGEIPMDMGSVQGIQSLNLSHNAVAGSIPSSLENLTLLESLDLSSNQLSGVIPHELTRLYFLQMLNLLRNLLTGQIPRGPQSDSFGDRLTVGTQGYADRHCQTSASTKMGHNPRENKKKMMQISFMRLLGKL